MDRSTRTAVCALGALALLAGSLEAQSPDGLRVRRWSLSFALGWVANDASGATLEQTMISGGFSDRSPVTCVIGLCGPSQPHPRTLGSRGPVWTFSLNYLATRWLELRASFAPGGQFPETLGYDVDDGWISLTPSVQTIAVAGAVLIDGVIHAGVGPSITIASLSDGRGNSYETTVPGVVLGAGIRLPPRTRFFLEITGQYRYIAPARFGPIEALPDVELDLSYPTLSAGLGVRF